MPRLVKTLSRGLILAVLAVSLSGCTGWIERQVAGAERALDCAVVSTAPLAPTSQMAHCATHPAAG